MSRGLSDRLRENIAIRAPTGMKRNAVLRYLYARAFFGRIPDEKNAIILYTMAKSGTHYFRFVFCNYLMSMFDSEVAEFNYERMQQLFPNSLEGIRLNEKPYIRPHPLFKKLDYSDFVYGHNDTGIEYSPASIIGVYRNPLDFLVSNYYYRYVNRAAVVDKPESADEIVDDWLPYLIKTYSLMDTLARRRKGLRVAYEELMRQPEATFALIIRWLGLPLDMNQLAKAIEDSQFDRVRAYEQKHGTIVANTNSFDGQFFTRSGKIGEWRSELKPETVDYIRRRLKENGINFSRFIIE